MKRKTWYSLFPFVFAGLFSSAQYKWEASLEPVQQDGFHRILLTPEVTSCLRPGFPDVRIVHESGAPVGYMVMADNEKRGPDRFVTYETVDKRFVDGCCSHITVMNKLQAPINHIVLEVKNADAKRSMTLSGSMDGKQWFVVKDVYSYVSFNGYERGQSVTSNLIRFDFPVTDYLYYRFEFDHWWWWSDPYHHPVNVIRAGTIEQTIIPQECITLPDFKIHRMEDGKESHLWMKLGEPQFTDHIVFSFSLDAVGFYRKAVLYEIERNEKDSILAERNLGAFVISSMHQNEFSMGNRKIKELRLVIYNEDNAPVSLDSLKAYQVKHYLAAELKKGKSYFLRFGNDTIPAPSYDLVHFASKIPADAPVIKAGARRNVESIEQVAEEEPFFKDKRFIWGALIVVALLLGFMSFRMLRETR